MASIYAMAMAQQTGTIGNIWPYWCGQQTAITTSPCGNLSNNTIWMQWVDSGTCNNTTGGYYAVQNAMAQQAMLQAQQNQYALPLPQLTEEERALAEERHAAAQKARQERAAAREAAEKVAMELLREHLSPVQRKALDKFGWFLVEGGMSKKTYRIEAKHYAGNIHEMEKSKPVTRLCVHASSEIPLGDQLLTQALSLQFDEEHIVAKANKTNMRAAS
jgi:hypothetical protein